MAHRGASYHAPENTAAAFKKAYDFNVDGIETDLQLTKDGEIVIHHNYYIDDTSDGRGAILTKTLEELKQYDFGKGEKILTLAELLPILDGMDIINLELKSPLDKEADYVGKVLDIVSKSGMKDKIIYSSFLFFSVNVFILVNKKRLQYFNCNHSFICEIKNKVL